jgi:purine-cytosine permease-like protein
MSATKHDASIIGLGVAACAACCAGPILAVLAAVGLGTVAGFALFGTITIVIGATIAAFFVIRRRRRAQACSSSESSGPVPVELTTTRSPL